MRYLSLLGLIVVLGGCVENKPLYTAAPHGPPRDLNAEEKKDVAASLSGALKDPGSAIFYWTPANTPVGQSGVVIYCGMVNSKNSYGAYVGASPFTSSLIFRDGVARAAALHNIASDTSAKSEAVMIICRENGYDPFSARP